MKYEPDKAGMRELARSAQIGAITMAAARIVEQAAKAQPVVRRGSETDRAEYRDSFGTRAAMLPARTKGGTEERAGAIVFNDYRLERVFGGRNRTLYRALGALNGVHIT